MANRPLASLFVAALAAALVAAPTPAVAAFPGANGKIAFVSNRDGETDFDIFAMNPNGSAPTHLTNNGVTDNEPAYSPNGQKIAYTTNTPETPGPVNREIVVANANGTGPVNVTNNGADDEDPSFSPDGKKIAFRSDRTGDNVYEIYVMDVSGENVKQLTSNSVFDGEPTWSPDGTKVIFNEVIEGNNEIVQKDAASTNPAAPPTNLTNDVHNDNNPSVAPNGRIAFSRLATASDYDIYVMKADGSGQTNITNNPASWDSGPAFSPDGTKIAFTRGAFDSADVWVMGAAGGNPVNLTPSQSPAREDSHPDWQPVPKIARTLTLSYSAGAFRGKLSSSPSRTRCFANKTVRVWRKVGAIGGPDDVKIGEDATSSTGVYVVPKTRKPGSYYARVPKQTIAAVGNCLAARSPLLTLK